VCLVFGPGPKWPKRAIVAGLWLAAGVDLGPGLGGLQPGVSLRIREYPYVVFLSAAR
jgi:hypothetical protein